MAYFLLEPEVASELGQHTELDTRMHPLRVHRLHYEITDWLGDELLESFPCFLLSRRLGERAAAEGLTGFELADVEVTLSPEAEELLALAAPAQAASPVQIYKVYYDSPGADTGSNTSLNAEYVVLKNTGRSAVSLTGWTLRDARGYVYTFGTFTLGAGKAVVVRTGKGTNSSTHRYWGRTWYVWNNTGDTATLRTRSGSLVDTCSWNRVGSDYRYC
ncbi:lamin tail domain-containing protein [Carbonactinospora thermoautotrophica]|uniref:lamin tail domain-containing protein n=1 Tax=Carbonactinospora thermoautotrophica TaxID=1469144 RepID=UPI0027E18FEF|nr:lamin tail domain-containing protein [Carbonactinospora thermoautotrophica]